MRLIFIIPVRHRVIIIKVLTSFTIVMLSKQSVNNTIETFYQILQHRSQIFKLLYTRLSFYTMKYYLSLIAFTVLTNLPAQNSVQWSDTLHAGYLEGPITTPRIDVLEDGTPLFTWGVSGNGISSQIYCNHLKNNQFSDPVGVVQSPAEPSLFGFGGYDLAVSGTRVFIVFEQIQHGIFLARSDDGGLSFEPPVMVHGHGTNEFPTLASVVVDGTGNPVVSYILEDNSGASYQVRRSTDGGQSFGEPVTANLPAPGGSVCECCTSDMIASGDTIWILFRNNNQNTRDIWVSRSTDLATTFTAASDMDATDWQISVCPISGPRMARSGDTLLGVWTSGAVSPSHVYLSTAQAGTLQAGQQLDFGTGTGVLNVQATPDIVASGDTVGVVYLKKSKEVAFHFSTSGASGISGADTVFSGVGQTFKYPSLAYRNSAFHLIYADVTAGELLYRKGTVSAASAVEAPSELSGVTIFPNPSGGIFSLQGLSGRGRVFVTDLYGKSVFSENTIDGQSLIIDLSNRSAGVYFIRAETAAGAACWKAVKI